MQFAHFYMHFASYSYLPVFTNIILNIIRNMNYNRLMRSPALNIAINQDILPGISEFPLSHSLLIQTKELTQAEQKINKVAEPLVHSSLGHANDINVRITALNLEKLKLFGVYYGAPVCIQSDPLDSFHILLPLQGVLSVEADSKNITITPGEAIIYPPGSCIKDSWSATCVMFVVIIPKYEMEQMQYDHMPTSTSLPQFVLKVNVKTGAGKSFTNLLACLCAEHDNYSDDRPISISSGLQELLLVSLLQLFSLSDKAVTRLTGTHKRRQAVGRAIDFIQQKKI